MAQRTVVQLTDDLDGSPIADGDGETVRLVYRGQSYELDLSSGNVGQLDKVLEPYLTAARTTSGGSSGASRQRASGRAPAGGATEGPDPTAVRAWAEANGVAVNSRGRLSGEVVEQYRAANP